MARTGGRSAPLGLTALRSCAPCSRTRSLRSLKQREHNRARLRSSQPSDVASAPPLCAPVDETKCQGKRFMLNEAIAKSVAAVFPWQAGGMERGQAKGAERPWLEATTRRKRLRAQSPRPATGKRCSGQEDITARTRRCPHHASPNSPRNRARPYRPCSCDCGQARWGCTRDTPAPSPYHRNTSPRSRRSTRLR